MAKKRKNKFESVKVICYHYHHETVGSIACDRITADLPESETAPRAHLAFSSPTERVNYRRFFCENYPDKCPYYQFFAEGEKNRKKQ